ncbi:MAG: efflux RND transporter permease subunit, partial [Candidatus Omnitrophica bacterium]|nr:efflux RND transporter permease subunit [Candidatus Omnitrophota bacterium]
MLSKVVKYFVDRHLLTNLICISVFIGGIVSWKNIKKEEMPDVTFDNVRISAVYPGATAEEVEHFVTKELEEAVEGIDGVYQVTSTASQGSTRVNIELEQDYSDKDEAISEIRNAVLDVKLPDDIRDDPTVRVFKTSKKAIIDIALVNREVYLLDVETRSLLQQYAVSLENQLINLPEVNSVNRSGYLQEEIQIDVDPDKLKKYKIPLSQIENAVKDNHVRQPAGNIEAKNEPKVTINAQLDTPEKLNTLYVQAGFEGQAITLKEVAEVKKGFNQTKEIIKVNGHQTVILNVVKNSSYGILEALDAVEKCIKRFKVDYLKDGPIDLITLDDESLDVRNRLSIIAINGGIGFVLIL